MKNQILQQMNDLLLQRAAVSGVNRRDFLKSSALLWTAAQLPFFTASAQVDAAVAAKYFFTFRMQGGWDVTLGPDPKSHGSVSTQEDMYIQYTPEEILLGADSTLRMAPAMASMAPFAKDLTIINGMFMSDSNLGHDSNLDYISTGGQDGGNADLGVEIAHAQNSGELGVLFRGQIKTAARSTKIADVNPFLNAQSYARLPDLKKMIGATKASTNFAKSLSSVVAGQDQMIGFLARLEELKKAHPDFNDSEAQAALVAVAAFERGMAYQIQIDMNGNLDTHSNHETTHLAQQKGNWDKIAKILQLLQKTPEPSTGGKSSLYDHTAIMVISEFARTPALNAAKGKDHNPETNSVVLKSPGLRGGLSFGESKILRKGRTMTGAPKHHAGLIDFANGNSPLTRSEAEHQRFQFIYPENVLATLVKSLGIQNFSSLPNHTPLLQALLKG